MYSVVVLETQVSPARLLVNSPTPGDLDLSFWITRRRSLSFHHPDDVHTLDDLTYNVTNLETRTDRSVYDDAPKTCLRSSQEATTVVMMNCEPLVFLPALAIENNPGLSCLSSKFSSTRGSAGGMYMYTYMSHSDGARCANAITVKLVAIDGFPARTVTAGKVAALDHGLGDDTVE